MPMTASFDLGQIAGPIFAGPVYDLTGSFTVPTLAAAAALIAAALLAGGASRRAAVTAHNPHDAQVTAHRTAGAILASGLFILVLYLAGAIGVSAPLATASPQPLLNAPRHAEQPVAPFG